MGLPTQDPYTPIRNALYIRGGTLGAILLIFAAHRDWRERDGHEPVQRFCRCALQACASLATLLGGFAVLQLFKATLSYKGGVLAAEASRTVVDSLNRTIEGCLAYEYDCKTVADNLGIYDLLEAVGSDPSIDIFKKGPGA